MVKKAVPKKATQKKTTARKPAAKKATTSPSRRPRKTAEEMRWQASGDLDTLRRADEIRSDASRLAAARTEASKLQTAIKKATK